MIMINQISNIKIKEVSKMKKINLVNEYGIEFGIEIDYKIDAEKEESHYEVKYSIKDKNNKIINDNLIAGDKNDLDFMIGLMIDSYGSLKEI